MDYFKKFASNDEYDAYTETTRPFVAWCVAENEMHYIKWTENERSVKLDPTDLND